MFKKLTLLFLAIFWGGVLSVALAQNKQVSGIVVGEDGSPVIGASIVVDGTLNGTTSGADGTFSLAAPANAKLNVSFVGYQPTQVTVSGNNRLRIVLKEDTQAIEDVVVVAFGKQKREAFTGSATVVKSEAITSRQTSDAISALNGRVAGLQMVESNSPSGSPTIRIRGISSINAGNDPLIIVDGLPYNGYWADINPADIESITVQKDAASNALYGARGANGVIMITTKSAKKGTLSVQFDAKWGVNQDAKVDYDYITEPGQYYEVYYTAMKNYYSRFMGQNARDAHISANEMLGSSAAGGLGYIVYSVPENEFLIGENGKLNPRATLGNVVSYDGKEYTLLPDDWRKEGIRTGFRQEYNVSLNGGTDRFAFYGSLGYLENEGLTYGSDYTRYTARMKADFNATEWLRIGGNVGYTHNESNSLAGSFDAAYTIAPIYPVYVRDGEGNIMTDVHGKVFDYGNGNNAGMIRASYKNLNPLQDDLLNTSFNDSNSFSFQGYFDIRFLKDFKLTINASIFDTENRITGGTNPWYGYYNTSKGYVSATHYRTYSANYQQLLNYDKQIGRHNLSVLLGHEYSRDRQMVTGGSMTNVYSFANNQSLNGAITKGSITGYTSLINREGFFLRAQYDFDGKYYFSGSYRRDGSSNFHPDHRWGNFWSLSGAWILSKEGFLQRAKWIDMLKLKVSYGEQGNDAIGSYYYSDRYSLSSANGEPALVFRGVASEDISWEKNGNLNAGVEFELFGNRLRGNVEYYRRKTSDMLFYMTVPTSLGWGGYYDNIGDMVNRGVEIELSADLIRTKKVQWSFNVNLTHFKNEVTRLPAEKQTNVLDGHPGYSGGYTFIGEGLPLNTWYMPKYAGVSDNGKAMWYYTDSQGELQTTTAYESATYYECGNAFPTLQGGFGTDFKFAGFDLTLNFLYSIGGKMMDYGYKGLMAGPTAMLYGQNIHKDVLNSWSESNPNTDIPCWEYAETNMAAISDRWLTDASSLTFKNIILGYTLPTKVANKLHLGKVRVYVACDNVAYWSKRKGFDPRTTLTGDVSGSGYSPIRTISGGINLAF